MTPIAQARRGRAFTLVELAVVLAIAGLLLTGAMAMLLAQLEQRGRDETQRRLEAARDLLIAFALVNRRLPCPAGPGTGGDESPPGGGACTHPYNGFLPGRALGVQLLDSEGYALDAWNNRLRYSIAMTLAGGTPECAAPSLPHFSSAAYLKANGIACRPADLVVCSSAAAGAACAAGAVVTNQNTVAAIVLSPGRNGARAAAGANEAENLDGDPVFVARAPEPAGAAGGEFDDMLVWLPAAVLYSRMVAAAVLP